MQLKKGDKNQKAWEGWGMGAPADETWAWNKKRNMVRMLAQQV
jgi:hypothetical protein